jgi:hypothetical protein
MDFEEAWKCYLPSILEKVATSETHGRGNVGAVAPSQEDGARFQIQAPPLAFSFARAWNSSRT